MNDPLSLNRYTYCHNDAVNGWDPSGHTKEDINKLNNIINKKYGKKNNTITFVVKQPVPGKRNALKGEDDVGHTFIRIQYGYMIFYYGFYPLKTLSRTEILLFSNVEGIVKVDDESGWNICKVYKAKKSKLSAVQKESLSYNLQNKYNLKNNNCTDFAVKMVKKATGKIPSKKHSWTFTKKQKDSFNVFLALYGGKIVGRSAGDAGEDIRGKRNVYNKK